MDGVPDVVDVGNLVGDELDREQRRRREQDRVSLEDVRHSLDTPEPPEESGDEDRRVDIDPARPTRSQDVGQRLHARIIPRMWVWFKPRAEDWVNPADWPQIRPGRTFF